MSARASRTANGCRRRPHRKHIFALSWFLLKGSTQGSFHKLRRAQPAEAVCIAGMAERDRSTADASGILPAKQQQQKGIADGCQSGFMGPRSTRCRHGYAEPPRK